MYYLQSTVFREAFDNFKMICNLLCSVRDVEHVVNFKNALINKTCTFHFSTRLTISATHTPAVSIGGLFCFFGCQVFCSNCIPAYNARVQNYIRQEFYFISISHSSCYIIYLSKGVVFKKIDELTKLQRVAPVIINEPPPPPLSHAALCLSFYTEMSLLL